MANTTVTTEEEFRLGVIPRAEISLATSRIAKEKATQANTKEFAGFEYEEAIAVLTVLRDLKTPVPAIEAKQAETMQKIETTAPGAEFDQAYIKVQLENHEELYALADDYLNNSDPATTDPAEQQGRHLATLSRATFKEHVLICKRISGELQG
jgi:putative membrane protein